MKHCLAATLFIALALHSGHAAAQLACPEVALESRIVNTGTYPHGTAIVGSGLNDASYYVVGAEGLATDDVKGFKLDSEFQIITNSATIYDGANDVFLPSVASVYNGNEERVGVAVNRVDGSSKLQIRDYDLSAVTTLEPFGSSIGEVRVTGLPQSNHFAIAGLSATDVYLRVVTRNGANVLGATDIDTAIQAPDGVAIASFYSSAAASDLIAIAWSATPDGGSQKRIYLKVYRPNGSVYLNKVSIAAAPNSGHDRYPAIGISSSGIVLAWQRTPSSTSTCPNIYFQTFTLAGAANINPTPVESALTFCRVRPNVATGYQDPNPVFALTWERASSGSTSYGPRAKAYTGFANPVARQTESVISLGTCVHILPSDDELYWFGGVGVDIFDGCTSGDIMVGFSFQCYSYSGSTANSGVYRSFLLF